MYKLPYIAIPKNHRKSILHKDSKLILMKKSEKAKSNKR